MSVKPDTAAFEVERDFAGAQLLGTRDEQQDAYAFSIVGSPDEPESAASLFVVLADGMGGHFGGRQASLAAVQGGVDAFFGHVEKQDKNAVGARGESALSSGCMAAVLSAANRSLGLAIRREPGQMEGAGTTFLAFAVSRSKLIWISVGDSPLLLWRGGKLGRFNADHSMRSILAEKVKQGQMPAADLADHPERNVLISALLGGAIEEIDAPTTAFDLQHGDTIVAASDGLLTLTGPEIGAVLRKSRKKPARGVALSLLDAVTAKRRPSQDNTTVAVVHI